jgi:hypothetical protein
MLIELLTRMGGDKIKEALGSSVGYQLARP